MELSFDAIPIFEFSIKIPSNCKRDFSPTDKPLSPQFTNLNLFSLSALNEPSLVQFIHRNLAYLILLFYLFIFYKACRNKLTNYFRVLYIIGVFLLLQIVLGIITILTGAQIFVSSMHQISSIFLINSSIYLLYLNTKTN